MNVAQEDVQKDSVLARLEVPDDIKTRLTSDVVRMIETARLQAESLVITDEETYLASFELRKLIKIARGAFTSGIDIGINEFHKAHKKLTGVRGSVQGELDSSDGIVERKRISYKQEQARIQAAKADRERLEAKQQQDDAALTHADTLEKAGEPEAAAAVLEHAATAPAPPVRVETAAPKSKGQVDRKAYKYTVVNEDIVPAHFKMTVLNHATIKAQVDSLGLKANIAGIEVTEVQSESVRL